jgi:hypothetical protein
MGHERLPLPLEIPAHLQPQLSAAASQAGVSEQEIVTAVLARALRHQPLTVIEGSFEGVLCGPELAAFVDELYDGSGWNRD